MKVVTDWIVTVPRFAVFVALVVLPLVGCGTPGVDPPTAPNAPTVEAFYGPRRVILTWTGVEGATHYVVREDPSGTGAFADVTGSITATSLVHEISLLQRVRALYTVEACNAGGCTSSAATPLVPHLVDAIATVDEGTGDVGDHFGTPMALSADGTTLAVAARGEAGSATGVNGDVDEGAPGSGAVYVFALHDGSWALEAYLKASDTEAGDTFGAAIALSADGTTLAVAATNRDAWIGDTPAASSGGVYVFGKTTAGWAQEVLLEPPYPTTFGLFGEALALSADGSTLAVGELNADSAAVGIDGDGTDASAPDAGAAYVYVRTPGGWTQQAYVKATNVGAGDRFGTSVSLSADGSLLVVGAPNEASATLDPDDDTAPGAGAVYLLERRDGAWVHAAFVKGPAPSEWSAFGGVVTVSADGSMLLVFTLAPDEGDPLGFRAGSIVVFEHVDGTWTATGEIRAPNGGPGDAFGGRFVLSHDASTLAVGMPKEASSARGVDGDEHDTSRPESGAAYVFTRTDGTWVRSAYVKGPLNHAGDAFGVSLGLSGDGRLLVVSTLRQAGIALGAIYAY